MKVLAISLMIAVSFASSALEWVVVANPSLYQKGRCKVKKTRGCEAYEDSVDTEHAVRCVSTTEKTGWRKNQCTGEGYIWAQSELNGECKYLDFNDAKTLCESVGGRLPTTDEVENGCTVKSGCRFGLHHVWALRALPTEEPIFTTRQTTLRQSTTRHSTLRQSTMRHSTSAPVKPTTFELCPPMFNEKVVGTVIPYSNTQESYPVGNFIECEAACKISESCESWTFSTAGCFFMSGTETKYVPFFAVISGSKTCVDDGSGCSDISLQEDCFVSDKCRWYGMQCVPRCEVNKLEEQCRFGCQWVGNGCKDARWCPVQMDKSTDGELIPVTDTQDYKLTPNIGLCEWLCDSTPDCTGALWNKKTQECALMAKATKIVDTEKAGWEASTRTCEELVCGQIFKPVACVVEGCRWIEDKCLDKCESLEQEECAEGCEWKSNECQTVSAWCPIEYGKSVKGSPAPSQLPGKDPANCKGWCDHTENCEGYIFANDRCTMVSDAVSLVDTSVMGTFSALKTCGGANCENLSEDDCATQGCRWFQHSCLAGCSTLTKEECHGGCAWDENIGGRFAKCVTTFWCDAVADKKTDGTVIPYSAKRIYFPGGTMDICQRWCDLVPGCTGVTVNQKDRYCALRKDSTGLVDLDKPSRLSATRNCNKDGQKIMDTAAVAAPQPQGLAHVLGQAALYTLAAVGVIGLLAAGYNARAQNKGYESL